MTGGQRSTTRLREIVARRSAVIAPGTPNALFAQLIAQTGFECAYVTGAGVANMQLGVPDIGLTSLNDMAQAVTAIADVTDLPLIVDADTGFGNPLNAYRAVRMLERAGAAAIQIEDQVFPKRCGHFSGKQVIAAGDMMQKIKAATDARRDGDLMIIARTDALATEGVDAALDRARAYVEAGADMSFIEAPLDDAQMARIVAEAPGPQIANMVFGGRTPELGQARLQEMGFSIVLYANAVLQAALKASQQVLRTLKDEGSLVSVADRLASFEERQAAVGKQIWDAREKRYVGLGA